MLKILPTGMITMAIKLRRFLQPVSRQCLFKAPPEGVITTVFDDAGLVVQALQVDHAPVSPAVGYLFSYGQRTALITGDTAQSENVKRFAQGVDLLVHEALAPNLMTMMRDTADSLGNQILSKIFFDVLDYHASPVEGGGNRPRCGRWAPAVLPRGTAHRSTRTRGAMAQRGGGYFS